MPTALRQETRRIRARIVERLWRFEFELLGYALGVV
jgi:hypothetical protein